MSELSHSPARLYWQMYRSLVGIGVLCGLIIVMAYQWTLTPIQKKRQAATQAAIFKVLPGARYQKGFILKEDGHFAPIKENEATPLLFAGYDEHKKFIGYAIPASGMGYQDAIELIYGYDPQQQKIIGMKVLDSRETPGLGSRIEDVPFQKNFRQLDVRLDGKNQHLVHDIKVVKHGTKKMAWEIDAISGATVSSRAVGNIIEQSVAQWLPRLRKQQQEFSYVDQTN